LIFITRRFQRLLGTPTIIETGMNSVPKRQPIISKRADSSVLGPNYTSLRGPSRRA